MKIENPYCGMDKFVYDNCACLSFDEIKEELGVTVDELLFKKKESFLTREISVCRKEGKRYRIECGDTIETISKKTGAREQAVKDAVGERGVYPCRILYIK